VRSMTGHGSGSSGRITVEIRAVNHRFFDLKLRVASGGPPDARVDEAVGLAVRRRAERGSFTVTLFEEGASSRPALEIDHALARTVHAALEELRRELGIPEPVPLALVVEQPGVLSPAEPCADLEAVTAALEAALDGLVAMRAREGASLAVDLAGRLERIAVLAAEAEGLAAAGPAEYRRRLSERLEKLLQGTGVTVDEQRLAAEVAVLADRTDVTEELVRLRSHLAQMKLLLDDDTGAGVGRRMDFLVQEIGREINTIGSKAQRAEITVRVVEAKAELEKIREQVQNVE
jgi:uncharacterized protein (TIGR00255 family)